jgi:predicted  nucleic acid-binding Zn-ribbon protein
VIATILKDIDGIRFQGFVVSHGGFKKKLETFQRLIKELQLALIVGLDGTGSSVPQIDRDVSPVKLAEFEPQEIEKLLKCILFLAVNSPNREEYIGRIQKLDENYQTEIMRIISEFTLEDVVHESVSDIVQTTNGDRELELEERISELIKQNEQLRQSNGTMQESLAAVQQELADERTARSKAEENGHGATNGVLLLQIEELKDKVDGLEGELAATRKENETNSKIIVDLTASADKYEKEIQSLKALSQRPSEADEESHRHAALVERYKIKAEAASREIETLRVEYSELQKRADAAERDLSKALKIATTLQPRGDGVLGDSEKLHEQIGDSSSGSTDAIQSSKRSTVTQESRESNAEEIESLKLRIEYLNLELDNMSSAWYALASRVQLRNQAVMKKQNSNPRAWITQQVRALERLRAP